MLLKSGIFAGLVVGVLMGRPVSADPLQTFVASYTDSLGSSFSGVPVTYNDLTQGATVNLGALPITGTPGPGGSYPLAGRFELDVSVQPLQGAIFDTARLFGSFSGFVLGPTGSSSNLGGGFNAPIAGAEFSPGSYNDIPALGALMLHSERVQVNANVVTNLSGKSSLDISMTISPPGVIIPPTPIPEPTALATIVLGLAGLVVRQKQTRRLP
jgi:hypothetical protein